MLWLRMWLRGGVALAIALKTKNTNKKALASSAGITAICGITEPALYGVTLQNKAAFIGSNVAGGVGGFFLGILGARNFAGASPGLLTIAAYIGEDTLKYFYTAIAGLVISVVVSFIVTFVLYKRRLMIVAGREVCFFLTLKKPLPFPKSYVNYDRIE